jgi:glutathione S-transferase
MANPELTLVGRSSSHFTRTARVFAHELGVPYTFRPVFDILAVDPAAYGDNPALKVPVLLDEQGPLYGSENICRELARRSGQRPRVALRGDVGERIVANAEEMVLHVMGSAVILITSGLGGPEQTPPPKVRRSLENALTFLDRNVDGVLAALPGDRVLSFFEVALFCVVPHLPFRKLLDASGYQRLQAFARTFSERPGAKATEYHFDAA